MVVELLRQGLSQQDVAKKAGVSRGTVRRWIDLDPDQVESALAKRRRKGRHRGSVKMLEAVEVAPYVCPTCGMRLTISPCIVCAARRAEKKLRRPTPNRGEHDLEPDLSPEEMERAREAREERLAEKKRGPY